MNDSAVLALLLVAVPLAIVTCGGDVVVDDPPEGSGGSGAATSGSSSSANSVASSSVSSGGAPSGTSVTTVGPSTGSGSCISCSVALESGLTPSQPLCPSSQPLFDAVVQCACASQCPYACGDNVCVGGDPSDTCGECVSNLCGMEFASCINDV